MAVNLKPMRKRRSTIYKDKLTKEFFMSIPPGIYLATESDSFAQIIDPPKEREIQWKSLQKLKAAGNGCYLSDSKGDFEEWQKTRSV